MNASSAASLASLPPAKRQLLLDGLSDAELLALDQDWRFWARSEQLAPPDPWRVWLCMAGRGFGKTRTGSEWILDRVRQGFRLIALVGQTPADARDVMIEGPAGILKVAPEHERPKYEPSKRRLNFPNGAVAHVYSGHEYEKLRGPQHDTAWVDELAAFQYPQETWDMLMFGLRLGSNPQCIVTTTPKPITLIRHLVRQAKARKGVVITGGSSYDNRANLSEAWFQEIVDKYEGTTLGEQELYARLLEEMPGALWQRKSIEDHRHPSDWTPHKPWLRLVIGIDPAITSHDDSNETGIIVAAKGQDGHAYVLRDGSGVMPPAAWARRAIAFYREFGAHRIVAETNQGGEMVELTLRTVDKTVSYKGVPAREGKRARAEPIAALYEKGWVHHVGTFPDLEDQMCTWVPTDKDTAGYSPDRIDALVWALTELMIRQASTSPPIGIASESYWAAA